jgi:hypothetical protein
MRVYSRIRRVKRKIGRGLKGNRLLMGPYVIRRDAPIAFVGLFTAASVAVAGATAFGIWPGLVLSVLLAGVIVVATATAIGYVRGLPDWPPLSVKVQARRNQWLRRPVYVAGRGGTPPKSVVVGGKVRVSP